MGFGRVTPDLLDQRLLVRGSSLEPAVANQHLVLDHSRRG